MNRGGALPISVNKVTKTYGRFHALDSVDLDVRSGEFLTLLGPSGSGKTTLLMVLAGFNRPDSGSVLFGDREVVRLAPHKRDVGMVFQSYALFPHMDVAGNIGFPLRLRGVARGEIARRVEQALETVKLGGYGSRRIEQLSGGQRQRVALARAIVFEPRILLMDEPLSALDKQLREHMQVELRQLHEKLGMTTVYVTHDQREALTMSDRIAVIDKGRIMQLDTPRRIYERPSCRFVAEFVGESAFLPVAVSQGIATLDGAPLKLGDGVEAPDGAMFLMVRPEKLRILPGGQQSGPDVNVLAGRVARFIYQGESFVLDVDLPSGKAVSVRGMTSSAAMASLPQTGDPVQLALDRGDTFLVPLEENPA
ncbi:ABC transporter ATP-binding protein [Aquibium microcysteis]|uniref:ABC transporter ATP-binding protein n=1 Tax=Aquibium microcysteis TaxID=675281 RepID=UPI00165D1298|nr:ABC transporter ATP-binding protein [Aquibium microcysteis]